MKLLQTEDYLLLIDEVARGQKGINWNTALNKLEILHHDYPEHSSEWNYLKLVVAYYPLTKEAKELDLPLLPNPFEEVNIKELAEEEYESKGWNEPWKSRLLEKQEAFIKGYKAAKSKGQYSLDEVINIVHQWDNHINIHEKDKGCIKEIEKFIQSLSTQRVPKEFIPEYDLMNEGYDKPEDYPYQECKVLKTTTNSSWKIELVGTYQY